MLLEKTVKKSQTVNIFGAPKIVSSESSVTNIFNNQHIVRGFANLYMYIYCKLATMSM